VSSKIETFSFSKERDWDVINHIAMLRAQRMNASQYVAELIRRDMAQHAEYEDLDSKIRRLINEALKDHRPASQEIDVEEVNRSIRNLLD
jgi:predicted DNA-binding ribbon-helix-helix protein